MATFDSVHQGRSLSRRTNQKGINVNTYCLENRSFELYNISILVFMWWPGTAAASRRDRLRHPLSRSLRVIQDFRELCYANLFTSL
jgi:hypothetical protein